jgi:hypothetical protein
MNCCTGLLPSPLHAIIRYPTLFVWRLDRGQLFFLNVQSFFSQVLIIDHFCDEEAWLQYNFYPLKGSLLHGTLCVFRFPKMNNFTCKVLLLLSYLILSFHAKSYLSKEFQNICKQHERMLKYLWFLYLIYNQIWLNYLIEDCHFSYITKRNLRKKKKHRSHTLHKVQESNLQWSGKNVTNWLRKNWNWTPNFIGFTSICGLS